MDLIIWGMRGAFSLGRGQAWVGLDVALHKKHCKNNMQQPLWTELLGDYQERIEAGVLYEGWGY